MKNLIYSVLFSCSCVLLITPASAQVGEVNYISDVLKVPLRSGPTTGHRILHRGLPSGTRVTVLEIDEEAGFTKVRTEGGMEGWVRSQYLVGEPIARDKLAAVQKRLQDLKVQFEKERQAHARLRSAYKEMTAQNQALTSQVQALTKELEQLKVVAADPITEHARNAELTKQNARLVNEVSELASQVRQLQDNLQREWMLYGGALVLIGLILGIVLKSRPRKTSYSRYM